jgi:hypothetical protein
LKLVTIVVTVLVERLRAATRVEFSLKISAIKAKIVNLNEKSNSLHLTMQPGYSN